MLPALVLTAGLGTRMRPLSYVRAKPAMPVGGEPLVRHILRRLAAAGVERAVLNLHHLPATVCAAVGDGADLGVKIRYSWEDPVLGSAGGPRRALPLLEASRFLVVNGDTLSDASVVDLVAEHGRSGALATLAVIPNPWPDRYGGVVVNEDGAVEGFVPRGAPGPSWHFIGLQAAEARAFAGLSPDAPSESVSWLYPRLMKEHPGSIRAFRTSASFFDIGTPADYLSTAARLAEAEGARSGWRPRPAGSVEAGEGCRVAASARLAGTVLWEDVTVGDDARLTGCVVADGVCIPPGAAFRGLAIVRADGRTPLPGEEIHGDLLTAPIAGKARSVGGTRPS